MKNLKYLLAATVFISINTWSSTTMTTSQICHLTPATKTCSELYDTFLVDLLDQVETNGEGFDKHQYIDDKLVYHRAELKVLENEKFSQKKQRKEPIVQATQPAWSFFDVFAFFQSFASILYEADKVQDDIEINDEKRQIAMYEKMLLTLPGIKKDLMIRKREDNWQIHAGIKGVKNPKELDAYTLMLKYLRVESLVVYLSEDFAKTSYTTSLGDFQKYLCNNNSLISIGLSVKGLSVRDPQSDPNKLSTSLYSRHFAGDLANKIISSRADPKKRKFEKLDINGLVDMDEFLKNFYSDVDMDEFLKNFYSDSAFNGQAIEYLNKYPQLDSLYLNLNTGGFLKRQEHFLSQESLETINGLLMRGLQDLRFSYIIREDGKSKGSRHMLETMFNELTHPARDKALALKELWLKNVTEGDAALFVKNLTKSKNNLEQIMFTGLPEVGRLELLNELTKIYSNNGEYSTMNSEVNLKFIVWSGAVTQRKNPEDFKTRYEEQMSRFLRTLASSAESKKLHLLVIDNKGLTDKNIKNLADAIESKKYLCPSYIDLRDNYITAHGARSLLEAIRLGCQNKAFDLVLFGNNVTKEAGESLRAKYAPYLNMRIWVR